MRVISNDIPPALARDRSVAEVMQNCRSEWFAKMASAKSRCEVKLFALRLDRGRSTREQWLDSSLPLRLESRERGRLDTCASPFELPPCGRIGPDRSESGGMNFATCSRPGPLSGDARTRANFGDEVGGIVRKLALRSTRRSWRSRVRSRRFGIATHAIARGGDVRRIRPS
jgi:hypothetical protein